MSSLRPQPNGTTRMSTRGVVILLVVLVVPLCVLATLDPNLPSQLDQLGNWIQSWSQHCHFACPSG